MDGTNVACLVYATFSNHIVVYHSIQMAQIGTTNLVETMTDRVDTRGLLAYFNCDGEGGGGGAGAGEEGAIPASVFLVMSGLGL